MIRINGITRDLYRRLDLLFGRVHRLYSWCSVEYIEEDTGLYTITLNSCYGFKFSVMNSKASITYKDKGGLEFGTNEFIEVVIA